MAESSIRVADYFIERSLDSGELLTPMQVLKLVYIAHGWNLALEGEPLIGEAVEAWKYGPVVPNVYHEFRHYGASPVRAVSRFHRHGVSDVVKPLLNRVYDVYHKFSGGDLSAMTHKKDTPWEKTVRRFSGEPPLHTPIPNNLIREYYSHLAKQDSVRTA